MKPKKEKTNHILLATFFMIVAGYLFITGFSQAMLFVEVNPSTEAEAFSNREFFRYGSNLYLMAMFALLSFSWTIVAGVYLEENWCLHIPRKPSRCLLFELFICIVGFTLYGAYGLGQSFLLLRILWMVLLGITAAILCFGYEKNTRRCWAVLCFIGGIALAGYSIWNLTKYADEACFPFGIQCICGLLVAIAGGFTYVARKNLFSLALSAQECDDSKKMKSLQFLPVEREKLAGAVFLQCGALTCRCISLLVLQDSYLWPVVRILAILLFLFGAAFFLREIIASLRRK
ncbi:MAG: hypothetical protein ACLUJC_05900 [Clostridia bacterium]